MNAGHIVLHQLPTDAGPRGTIAITSRHRASAA